MKCPKCGAEIPESASFCPECGNTVLQKKSITVKNEISLSPASLVEVYQDGKLMGSIASHHSINVDIVKDCDIELKKGLRSQKYHIDYNSPLSVVCFLSLLGFLRIETAPIDGIDRAISVANDAKRLRVALLVLFCVVIGGILLSEVWDWLSVQF